MGRQRKKHPIKENIEIIDIASSGKAIGKDGDLVIFVTGVIPGDIVDIQINRKKSGFMEGYPIKFHKYSEKRIEAECEHFGVCGGCKWQTLPYKEQLFYKQKQVVDSLTRIGKVEIPEIQKILPSENIFYYRNKLEYTFSNRRWLKKEEIGEDDETRNMNGLGFHIPKMFDKVVDVNKCYLQKEPSNKIRLFIKKYALENNLSFFDIRNESGFLRNLIIRTSTTNELMVVLSVYENNKEEIDELLTALHKEVPEITSLMYVVNNKPHDSITDLDIELFAGKDHFIEKIEDLEFKVGPKSFFQTNSEQAYNLYKVTRDFAQLTGGEIVYDLYTGTGTIANFVAKKAKKVVGIEYVPEAIVDAKINSDLNNITNTVFFAGDIKNILSQDFINEHGKPDTIILDPPRPGVHKDVIKSMLYANPNKIVYVSCNPATQARDIELLSENYKVVKIQPVDMFPQTHHVENVVLLERK